MRPGQDAPEQVDGDVVSRAFEHFRGEGESFVWRPTLGSRLVKVGLDEVVSRFAHHRVGLDRDRVAGCIGEHEDTVPQERPVVLTEKAHDLLNRRALGHRLVDDVAREGWKIRRPGRFHRRRRESVEPQSTLVHPALWPQVVEPDVDTPV